MNPPCYLNQLGMLCALGNDTPSVSLNLQQGYAPGMQLSHAYSTTPRVIGQVLGVLPSICHQPVALRSRNNQLLLAALNQIRPAVLAAITDYGADRVGVILGTSTSGIETAEQALVSLQQGSCPDWFNYQQIELGSPAAFLQAELGLTGPAYCISTACSSSANALSSAARLLQLGVVDVVLTGGVDSLCRYTLAGFAALESLSSKLCQPFAADRDGINIGEGAALFLMSRQPSNVSLSGWGASSDAHHMSAPEPSGQGAFKAMQSALARAQIPAAALDYLNLHGTATNQNDAMESLAVRRLEVPDLWCSSTKALTGHTLGAAGAIEAALCWLCLQPENQFGWLPSQSHSYSQDSNQPPLKLAHLTSRLGYRPQWVMSNSFAFGGNNAALIMRAH